MGQPLIQEEGAIESDEDDDEIMDVGDESLLQEKLPAHMLPENKEKLEELGASNDKLFKSHEARVGLRQ